MLVELIILIVGVLAGGGISHIYYRRSKADITAQLEALRADIERLVTAGLVTAARNATGQIKSVGLPSAPTDFRLF